MDRPCVHTVPYQGLVVLYARAECVTWLSVLVTRVTGQHEETKDKHTCNCRALLECLKLLLDGTG